MRFQGRGRSGGRKYPLGGDKGEKEWDEKMWEGGTGRIATGKREVTMEEHSAEVSEWKQL